MLLAVRETGSIVTRRGDGVQQGGDCLSYARVHELEWYSMRSDQRSRSSLRPQRLGRARSLPERLSDPALVLERCGLTFLQLLPPLRRVQSKIEHGSRKQASGM